MSKVLDQLSAELINTLQGEKIVSLITKDAETGEPNLDVISWLLASPKGDQISFAVGHKASSAKNIEKYPSIILGVIGAGSCYSIKGTALVSDIIERTMKYRVVTVDIQSVEDVIFYGGKISIEPAYVKTYNADLAEKLDHEVYCLLKESFRD
ncbi:pyridoxamine 5'-phosphate oxidase [Ammoniphilus sp. YIM 78166]|uniref:pyridoxamine 5'-phosphate oxidase n=1 Tax=Ammoniphilus sp. YIM 78166 TaxID=1644106 RepID=UPI00106F88A8|nr:pyridoxamine 5'-phosphate oxidase [Ammoniphilus sp. YIM 78166]